jgi:hypothetical protein
MSDSDAERIGNANSLGYVWSTVADYHQHAILQRDGAYADSDSYRGSIHDCPYSHPNPDNTPDPDTG